MAVLARVREGTRGRLHQIAEPIHLLTKLLVRPIGTESEQHAAAFVEQARHLVETSPRPPPNFVSRETKFGGGSTARLAAISSELPPSPACLIS